MNKLNKCMRHNMKTIIKEFKLNMIIIQENLVMIIKVEMKLLKLKDNLYQKVKLIMVNL